MSIDLSQFIPTFLEESSEGLELMESSLLDLDGADPEVINAIFRAAHSIKGGAGTFGFTAVADFTHVVETLLDEMRNGQRGNSQRLTNLLLTSVDCMRLLLDAARDGVECSDPQVAEVHLQLQAELSGEAPSDNSPAKSVTSDSEVAEEDGGSKQIGWHISFLPAEDMLQTGNDPLLMFQGLEDLGTLSVEVNVDRLPAYIDFEPELTLLDWNLALISDCAEADVREVFEWVEDDCELVVIPMMDQVEADTEESVNSESNAEAASGAESAAAEPAASAAVAASPNAIAEAAQPTPAKPAKPAASAPRKPAGAEVGSIRVGIDKVDALINRVGELVITQSMLGQIGSEMEDVDHPGVEKLYEGLNQLERNTRDLQEEVMRIRMLPISFVFNRFPRMVHDVSDKLNKKVELQLSGEQTELDKTVMEKIGDPLVHLVRNSLDHGLETPEERIAAGKAETGIVQLNAYHQGGYIVIEIVDDGRGLNSEKIRGKAIEKGLISADQQMSEQECHELIFLPGFSTADQVSDLSGRGVGMDVVRRNIESVGGHVSVKSETGGGSTFTVSLPLTLAILDGQLVQVASETYIMPLVSIVESMQLRSESLNAIAGNKSLYHFRDEYIPLINVRQLFGLPIKSADLDDGLLVIVESGDSRVGLVVDDLLGQQQVVIKSLESNFKRVDGISGATILGDGGVALIMDVAGMIKLGLDQATRNAVHSRNEQFNQHEEKVA
ncbi:chemotaxis protein CheA [Marinobacterium jannaschii]|uniref:chemotaxis protein CheA n=1 Tax=Marinobacterium jannaschii TaxID=64970 RepID=UPI000684CFA0|nr:chemotaxis protein CheA [Marinobacterium jannaschii]